MTIAVYNKKILYAEDDVDDQLIFEEMIREVDSSISVITVDNGLELINYLQSVQPDFPSCIVLDINMPVFDGINTLQVLRKDKLYQGIPIIMFTSSNNEKDVFLCKKLGASDFITKPSRIVDFKDVGKRFVAACHHH